MRKLSNPKRFWGIVGIGCFVLVGVGGLAFVIFKPFVPSKPHACPTLQTPVDASTVVSILYPGQTRGGHYKAHGGFRVAGASNAVEVKAPLHARLVNAGRYIEQGEVQYIFDFSADCGLDYRFDHFLTLSPKLQAVAEKLPPAQENNSMTHRVSADVHVTAGEVLATEVGFRKGPHGPNVSFDFGVYDRGVKNDISKDLAWAAAHKADGQWFNEHALCWLDLLPNEDSIMLKALPGGDAKSGKTSDYC